MESIQEAPAVDQERNIHGSVVEVEVVRSGQFRV